MQEKTRTYRLFASLVALVAAGALSTDALAQAPERPRLGVIVVFDQLRSADIERSGGLFEDGFGGLMARDAARFDAYYPYSVTETGPGHATLATGAIPAVHGIVSSSWYVGEREGVGGGEPVRGSSPAIAPQDRPEKQGP